MDENHIPQQFDITLISKKNFRTILEILQWWRKLFLKLTTDHVNAPVEKPKVTFQVKKSLRLQNPPEKHELPSKKETIYTHEQMVKQLNDLKKEHPKEALIISNEQIPYDNEKENQLYPNI